MPNNPIAPSTSVNTPTASFGAGLPKEVTGVINIVRAQLRDYPELNRLVAGHETSDSMILTAMMEAADDFNTTPPLIEAFGLVNFPSISLLVRGTIVYILESLGFLQVRNQLAYSDGGGVTVQSSDKGPLLMQWAQLFSASYESKKVKLKMALNLRGALNGSAVPSEYRAVNGLWDLY